MLENHSVFPRSAALALALVGSIVAGCSGGSRPFWGEGPGTSGHHFEAAGNQAPLIQVRTRYELWYAAQDLLGDRNLPFSIVEDLPADPRTAGFDTVANQVFDEALMKGRFEFAERVALRAVRSKVAVPCQPTLAHHVPWDGCIGEVVTKFASRAFRRNLGADEIANYKRLFETSAESVVDQMRVDPDTRPVGFIDVVAGGTTAQGWSLDPNWPERSVEIHFYMDGGAGVGEFAGVSYTNLWRPDVVDHYKRNENVDYPGDHGYAFRIPDRYLDGGEHELFVYAIASTTGRANPYLGSLKFRAAAAPDGTAYDGPPQLSAPTEEGLKSVFTAILMSPSFQLRSQLAVLGEEGQRLDLASRLANFLSGGLPDAQLLARAQSGELADPKVFEAEAKRLIETYSQRFASNIMGQWMGYREFSLETGLTDLDRAFVNESTLVFKDLIDRNMKSDSILRPGFTYANSMLAGHYGIPDPGSSEFKRVETKERGGILSQGALHRSTAPTGFTKPIIRGKWVQAAILCRTIPSPSPELFQIIEESKARLDPSWPVWKRLETHRSTGTICNSCHQYMDPLGLALESYGPTGLWRSKYDDGQEVVSSGKLDGEDFANVHDLLGLVEKRPDFRSCVVKKLLTHALSRPLASGDLALVKELSDQNLGLKDLMVAIAKSAAFQAPRKDP